MDRLFGQVGVLVAMCSKPAGPVPGEDWYTLANAYGAGEFEMVKNRGSRLYEAQSWGDPDYSTCVTELLQMLHKKDENDAISLAWLLSKEAIDMLEDSQREEARRRCPLPFQLVENPEGAIDVAAAPLKLRPLIDPEPFKSIEPRTPYLKLIEEINTGWTSTRCTGSAILCRKLMENLLLSVMLEKFKSDQSFLSAFYDSDKNRVRDLSALISEFEKSYETDFRRRAGLSKKADISRILQKVKHVKDTTDSFAHNLLRSCTKDELEKIARDLNEIAVLLITIWTRLPK